MIRVIIRVNVGPLMNVISEPFDGPTFQSQLRMNSVKLPIVYLLKHSLRNQEEVQRRREEMAHSKRNTSLPHFTSYERSLLRSNWGTQRTRLSRESFLPFGSCQLCLQPARAPVVACATNGDLFCRECAINDLLAQRKEIKRLEKEREDSARRTAEDEARMMEEARERELKEFELISMGLEGGRQENNKKRKAPTMEKEPGKGDGNGKEELLTTEAKIDAATEAFRQREIEVNGKRRKVFELSEAEIARYANSELERLKKKIEREKVYPLVSLSYHLN